MIDQLLRTIAGFYRNQIDRHPMLADALPVIDAARPPSAIAGDPKPVTRHLAAVTTSPTRSEDNQPASILTEFLAVADRLPWSQPRDTSTRSTSTTWRTMAT